MNKRGVSEVVSYVLLIIIAVGISVMVFAYLKVYIPKFETPECPADISIIVDSATCQIGGDLTIKVVNKGFFTVDAIYIKLKEPQRTVKSIIDERFELQDGLAPGENKLISYTVPTSAIAESYSLEVQPAVRNEKNELALCDSAIISQSIQCSA